MEFFLRFSSSFTYPNFHSPVPFAFPILFVKIESAAYSLLFHCHCHSLSRNRIRTVTSSHYHSQKSRRLFFLLILFNNTTASHFVAPFQPIHHIFHRSHNHHHRHQHHQLLLPAANHLPILQLLLFRCTSTSNASNDRQRAKAAASTSITATYLQSIFLIHSSTTLLHHPSSHSLPFHPLIERRNQFVGDGAIVLTRQQQ